MVFHVYLLRRPQPAVQWSAVEQTFFAK